MKQAGVDVVRIVWAAEYEPLHVEPSADGPGYVRLLTKTKESEEFWGRVDITMPVELARALAAALVACADEQTEGAA
jgi:hypothetical protein